MSLPAPDLRATASDLELARRLRPLAGKPPGSLVIHEIYLSIQGESTFAGLPCVFVRLSACHLRCGYCDTPHAFHQGETLTLDEVVSRSLALGDDLVEVTGGEPLLQPECFPLMERLADAGRTVLLETSGSLDISEVDPRVRVILDLKLPTSGESDANFLPNLPRLRPIDELKLVIGSRSDFDWGLAIVREYSLSPRVPILISPVFGQVEPVDLARWILDSRLPLRLQVQLQKIVWDPRKRGV